MQLKQFQQPIKESATLAINQKAKRLRQDNSELTHLGFGESPFPIHPKIQQSLRDNSHRKQYLPGLGLPILRTAIAQFHNQYCGYNLTAEDIAVGPGSKELLFQALHLLSGDVLIPSPSWVSYQPQANILDKRVLLVPTQFENHYQLRVEDLVQAASAASSDQKILILNSPSNPTGQVYSNEQLAALAAVCRQYNIVVVCDEIYALVSFQSMPDSLAKHCPERTIITSGLSKAFSAGGYRLGFLATKNQAFIKQLSVIISETYSCVSAPIQYAAVTAYQDDPEIMQYINACNQIHERVLAYACTRFQQMGINCLAAQGGFYLFPDFLNYQTLLQNRKITSSIALCHVLLEEIALALLPGEDFGYPETRLAVRAAIVDYDGDQVYQQFMSNQNHFGDNVSDYIPHLKNGLDRLEKWLNAL